jgi:chemotaxis protein CheD
MSCTGFMAVEEAPESVYLHPGQIYTARHAAFVSTVLGSCVAVCLWDPIARVGGVNHFLLPKGKGPRYGNEATQQLLDEMTNRGAFTARLIAKVFGGACVLAAFNGPGSSIGAQNVEAAKKFLARTRSPSAASKPAELVA